MSQIVQTELMQAADILKQERMLYRDALIHDCEYAYVVAVSIHADSR